MGLLTKKVKPVSTGTKHVSALADEFETTRAIYVEKLETHAADAADRHEHVTNRLSTLEQEANRLQELRGRISAA